MTTLRETLTAPDKKPAVVADLTTLIEGEDGTITSRAEGASADEAADAGDGDEEPPTGPRPV